MVRHEVLRAQKRGRRGDRTDKDAVQKVKTGGAGSHDARARSKKKSVRRSGRPRRSRSVEARPKSKIRNYRGPIQ